MPLPKIITCYTTITDKEHADRLIKQLLESKLIACGVSWQTQSQYIWNQEPISDHEYVVYMKSATKLKQRLMSSIQEIHPYDVPCILIHEVECNETYHDWVHDQTGD